MTLLAVAAGVGLVASILGARWALRNHNGVSITLFALSCWMMFASAAGGAFAPANRAPLGPAWAIVMQDGDGTHCVDDHQKARESGSAGPGGVKLHSLIPVR